MLPVKTAMIFDCLLDVVRMTFAECEWNKKVEIYTYVSLYPVFSS